MKKPKVTADHAYTFNRRLRRAPRAGKAITKLNDSAGILSDRRNPRLCALPGRDTNAQLVHGVASRRLARRVLAGHEIKVQENGHDGREN